MDFVYLALATVGAFVFHFILYPAYRFFREDVERARVADRRDGGPNDV